MRVLEGFSLVSSPTFSTVNMKQFRDAQYPASVCYQAIVTAEMKIDRVNAGGMLGDDALLRGDPSAGYQIRIHSFPTLPILRSLGIESEAEPPIVDFSI